MTVNSNPRIIIDNLVLCLDAGNVKSYPGSGTAWTNLAETSYMSQYNATLENSPTYNTSGQGSILFDGTNDGALAVDAPPVNFFTSWSQQITIEAWINYTTSSANNTAGIITRASSATNNIHGIKFVSQNNISASFIDGSNNSASPSSVISPNIWYHLTAVWNGSTASLYVNGSLASTSSGSLTGNTTSSNAFQIGRIVPGNYFNGYISSTKIYNTALTASQISQNFNALRGRFGI